MRLKSFEAHGFKSFADKVEMKFEDGVTAIVGPNGSGKSNISDAIRWVMGEQSVKYLRGSKMEDVIFAGSGGRRALGMAEVTLSFDNADHSLALDFDEVSLRRRVFRSGDSEYFINNKSCRLKDVVALLADTGLGRGSMSVIGQNRIDEILNSRPEDRRALFEEAASIAKYRIRKKEALRKLEETGSNLLRIYDIKSEVEGRIEPLKEAAAVTKKYLELATQLRKVQVTYSVHRIENIAVVKDQLTAKLQDLQKSNEEIVALAAAKEAVGLKLKVELDGLNDEYNALQMFLAEKENNIEKLHGQEAVLKERIAQSERVIERIAMQKEKLRAQLRQMEDNLQTVSERYDALDRGVQTAQSDVETCTEEKEQIQKRIGDLELKLSDFKSNVFEGMQKIVDLRNDIRTLEQEQAQRQRLREQLKNDINKSEALYNEVNVRHNALMEEQASLEAGEKIIAEQKFQFTSSLDEAKRKLAEITQRRNSVGREVEGLEARLNVLENMEKAHDGFSRGVKALLNSDEAWRNKLLGVVADLITVEDKYVTAIETALGGALQNLVMQNAETAKQAINYLKKNSGGRATFLPLDSLRVRAASVQEAAVLSLPGVLGWGADFVTCDSQAAKAVQFLLGRVVLTENMDAALLVAKKSDFKLRVVTLEGDVVFAGGSMSGGQKQNSSFSFLSRKQELEKLYQTVGGKNKVLLGVQEELEECESVTTVLETKLTAFEATLQKNAIRKAELIAFLDRSTTEKAQHMENISLLTAERNKHNSEFLAARERLIALKPQLVVLENEDAASKEEADRLQKELGVAKSKQSVINIRYQDAVIALNSAKEQVRVIAERLRQMDEDVSRLQKEVLDTDEETEKTRSFIVKTQEEKDALVHRQEELLQELKNTGDGKELFLSKRTVLSEQQAVVQAAVEEVRHQQSVIQQKLRGAELEQVKQITEYEGALEQMLNAFKLTPAEAREQELILELSDTTLKRQEGALQADITSLGVVNMAAVEEYKAVSERFEFLDKQYNDLCTAKGQLEEVIGGINQNMSKRYKEAFAKINEYFGQCYAQLFGGGSAQLVLQDERDILESGVEIVVQPPGKKLQNLNLLSGGERTLTVIALLFALLSYQPAPFCILDEIDAALDEANIGRFANFLMDYAKHTQFIVITHRRGTMEVADVLHGVTMEESGVSKLLSVKLADYKE